MINEDFNSISAILNAFPNEQICLEHLESLRWNGVVISPFDSNSKVYTCQKNRYRCRNTGKYFNVKTNTIFHNSKIELQKWFITIWLLTSENKTITSIELASVLEITQKSAWYMLKNLKTYFQIEKKPKLKSAIPKELKSIEEIEVIVEKDKLQMVEWLKQLKK